MSDTNELKELIKEAVYEVIEPFIAQMARDHDETRQWMRSVEQGMRSVEGRLAALEQRLERLEQRLERLEARVETLERRVTALEIEVRAAGADRPPGTTVSRARVCRVRSSSPGALGNSRRSPKTGTARPSVGSRRFPPATPIRVRNCHGEPG